MFLKRDFILVKMLGWGTSPTLSDYQIAILLNARSDPALVKNTGGPSTCLVLKPSAAASLGLPH